MRREGAFICFLFLFSVTLLIPKARAQTELVGRFTIEAGSRFILPAVGGTVLLGGIDGGLITGQFQPDEPPTTASSDDTGSNRIIDPSVFVCMGFPGYVSTNQVDPRDGGIYPPPSIREYQDVLSGDLSSWDWLWNGMHVNQGAPKPAGGNAAPAGTYDPGTRTYSLSWGSLFLNGPFDGFTGEWLLVGRFIPACESSDPVLDCDSDGILNGSDNCVASHNPDQADCDGNGIGDDCDKDSTCADWDGDGVANAYDNCLHQGNPDQADCDADGIGDLCDDDSLCSVDTDKDGVMNHEDNCLSVPNADQADCDGNGLGDACDLDAYCADRDRDGRPNAEDNCPNTYNPAQRDCDMDGIGDLCDAASLCSRDTDGDGVPDQEDNCVSRFNPDQLDCDRNGIGNACDLLPPSVSDPDGDCILNEYDNCPAMYNPDQLDCDKDGRGMACDPGDLTGCRNKVIGLFTIESGSYFSVQGVGAASFLGGTEGGLVSGQFQPDPPPQTASGDWAGCERIIDPTSFLFFSFPGYVSTNGVDPADGVSTYWVPLFLDRGDGTIIGDLPSWDWMWSGTHFNQGAPKYNTITGMVNNPAPIGTYDPVTGAYALFWTSLIYGGPFSGFTGEWTLAGYAPARPMESDGDGIFDPYDNCPNVPNPNQSDLDGDGLGDLCDPDADNDGSSADDCDDLNPGVHPSAAEICGNSLDENCDGIAEMCEIHDVSVTALRVPRKVLICSTSAKIIEAALENSGGYTEAIRLRMTWDGVQMQEKTVILDPGFQARVSFQVLSGFPSVGPLQICMEAGIDHVDQAPSDNQMCGTVTVVNCQ